MSRYPRGHIYEAFGAFHVRFYQTELRDRQLARVFCLQMTMSLATDTVSYSQQPDRWHIRSLSLIGLTLGTRCSYSRSGS
jgi:hypothetical protein